ncbi:MAG: M42 family metallopeptidase [Oscillospiraceae bacterium]|nr:M42 family metallopeptidase [Oscillospiraceae bacterium]
MKMQELETLCKLCGTSGRENDVRAYILNEIKALGLTPTVDNLGNVLVHKEGRERAKHKLMFSAHMDEVALMVTAITEDGSLKFDMVGGVSAAAVIGRQVLVGKQQVLGVIGTKPVHHLSCSEKKSPVKMSELCVDIGAKSKEEAQTLVRLGDIVYFMPEYRTFGDGCIAAKAIDDRFGCAVLLSLLRQDLPYDTEFAFVVQEEVGLRGAGVAANTIAPEFAVVFEATTAADVAGCSGADAVCKLGGGAVISFMDGRTVYDAELYRSATELAEQQGIAWQTKTKIAGGNDAGAIQNAAHGVRVLAVSVPCRYLHSPVCVIRQSDAEACEALAKSLIPMIQTMGDSTDDC